MTLRLQTNAWSCGPTALYNAIQTAGVRCGLRTILRISGIGPETEDTVPGLRAAASHYGYSLPSEFCHSHPFMRETVRTRSPLLLCVDRDHTGIYVHWIATIRATSRHVWIADSARPGPVVRRLTWNEFLARAITVLGPENRQYSYMPLVRRREAR